MATVRAYGKQRAFIRRFERDKVDVSMNAFWAGTIVNRWIGSAYIFFIKK